ncbi:rod shape-determining protein MreC [Pseudobacillus badius]|uniref:rod shape-determining protein MreC n=1 Tax=Bacillus badius TaxID=1455 RepID=UPI0007B084EC|nr:rod shape-determining protein MreC [Bacillus badius]KZN98684.1 rod shape-determining protein MreC [Bacillus badius]MED0666328.1 rod shape-determining protein MreC [Bacillus badius]OCS83623.1 rod shape-determining protein MreC [Bacillus badius]OVE53090.1 rod shape-determining protein MreC [Bacillus badius]TDW05137.1 rod shape-determining protein MreC [Bacillus badius]
MPQFFTNKRLIVLLGSIIVLVALIGFSLRDRENLSWPEQFVKDIVGLGQAVVSKPANGFAGFFDEVKDLRNTYEENKELKARIEKTAQLESDVARLQKDNQELRKVLDKKKSLADYEPVQATVIARNPDRWFDVITIDQGEATGIEPDMAVITAEGLIGKVKSTSKFTSTVQLLSAHDSRNRVSAVIQGKNSVYGVIEGYDKEKKTLLMTKIPYDSKVKKGMLVTTSGKGGVFPKGLIIGKIKKMVPDEFGLTQTALIEPAASFNDLEHVMVAKRSMTTVRAEKEERKQVLIEEGNL